MGAATWAMRTRVSFGGAGAMATEDGQTSPV